MHAATRGRDWALPSCAGRPSAWAVKLVSSRNPAEAASFGLSSKKSEDHPREEREEIYRVRPRQPVKKYLHVVNIGIQNTLVYRINFLFRSMFALIPLMATISLWRTIYSDKPGSVAGYTLAQMVSYYLVVTIVDALTAVAEDD